MKTDQVNHVESDNYLADDIAFAELNEDNNSDHISETHSKFQRSQIEEEIEDKNKSPSSDVYKKIARALSNQDKAALWEEVRNLHEADLADVIEWLTPKKRVKLISDLGSAFNFRALPEIEDNIREQLVAKMPKTSLWRAVAALDAEDAADLLEDLDAEELEGVLVQLPIDQRSRISQFLSYEESSAGRVMQTAFIAVPPHWDVGYTIDYIRNRNDLPAEFSYIFVVKQNGELMGRVPLSSVISSKRAVQLRELVKKDVKQISTDTTFSEIASIFEKYGITSVAVIDENHRFLGYISSEEAVFVVHEELDEDIRNITGVLGASITDAVWAGASSRILWLIINLFTAGIAATVVGVFSDQIKTIIALAVLLPIVPSVAGNAGIQTLTLTVRAISEKTITNFSVIRLLLKELGICITTGSIVGVFASVPIYFLFNDMILAFVVMISLIANVAIAGIGGISLPLLFNKIGVDPAIASPIFVTMLTDVAGLAIFLGAGTMLLL